MLSATSRSTPSSEPISRVTRSPAPATCTVVMLPAGVASAASVEPPPRSSTTSGRSVPGVVSAPRVAISASTPPITTSTPGAPSSRSRFCTESATARIGP